MTTFALFEFDKLFVDASFVLDTDVFCWGEMYWPHIRELSNLEVQNIARWS